MLGNVVCFVGYAVVLWTFFRSRITSKLSLFDRVHAVIIKITRGLEAEKLMCDLGEEELLIKFFGESYVAYRERTKVGIPFIR